MGRRRARGRGTGPATQQTASGATCAPASAGRTQGEPPVVEALLRWIPAPESKVSVAAACRSLAAAGFRGWDVGRTLRRCALFRAIARDESLPEGFQQTSFLLNDQGQAAWLARHPGYSRPRHARRPAPSAPLD